MTTLRQRMIDDMQLRNLAAGTQRKYIADVAAFARFFGKSPEVLDTEAVREYLLYLYKERELSPQAVNQQASALKFLYLTTLKRPWNDRDIPRPRRPHRLPVVLSPQEVLEFLDCVPSLKYRAALMLCYGAGLRVSEAVALKVSDVDSQRMLIRIEQGKGRKDRYTMLSPRLLEMLRTYWRAARPKDYLFPSGRTDRHLHRPRPKTPGRRDRLFRHSAHLGAESALSSTLALRGPRRRPESGPAVLGGLSAGLFPSGTRALAPLSPPAPCGTRGSLPGRRAEVLWRSGIAPRRSSLRRLSGPPGGARVGSVRQTGIRRSSTGAGVSGPLHASSRPLQ